jgi:large subunit ribosomal protein L7/L12
MVSPKSRLNIQEIAMPAASAAAPAAAAPVEEAAAEVGNDP